MKAERHLAPLSDPTILAAYRNALADWRFSDFIRWTEKALTDLRRELEGWSIKEVARVMHEHVENGGEIDAVVETRPEWSEHRYHYDLRINVDGKPIYIETRLFFTNADDPDDPWIHVVSLH